MSERDDEVERIVDTLMEKFTRPGFGLPSVQGVQLGHTLAVSQLLGAPNDQRANCIAAAWVAEGARRMQEKCVGVATMERERCADKPFDHYWSGAEREAEEIRVAILALKPEDV